MYKAKLLVLTSTFPRWKTDYLPSFVFNLSKRLCETFDVHVLAPYSPGTQMREVLDGVNVHRFRYWHGKRDYLSATAILPALKKNRFIFGLVPFFVISQWLRSLLLIKKYNIDVVHAHWILPQGFLAVLSRKILRRNLRVIITAHGADIWDLRPFDRLKRWTIENCHALAVVSESLRAEARKIGVKGSVPIEVVPMGVDLSSFSPMRPDRDFVKLREEDGPLILFVGRLTIKKGAEYAIRAMPQVLERHPGARLVLVGYGEERNRLMRLAEGLDLLDGKVHFLGGVNNDKLPGYYAAADVFVCPSIVAEGGDSEGFGLVLVEAMGCGCPVVASDLPAIRDIVTTGKTGLLVNPGDHQALAHAVNELSENKTLTETLGKRGREYVLERFDWRLVTARYNALLSGKELPTER